MVLSDDHAFRTEVNLVLVVVLGLAQRVVLVDVLHVGIGAGAGHVFLVAVLVHRRVALGVVVFLVSVVDLHVVVVVLRAAEVHEVVARRILRGLLVGLAGPSETLRHLVQVPTEETLLVVQSVGGAQTVVSDVLIHAALGIVIEGVDDGLRRRHTSPNGGVHIDHRGARRQPVLETLPSVAKNILADVAKVDVELAALVVGVFNEGVHQPELDGLDVLGFEVGVVQFAHDAAPTAGGIHQRAAVGDAGTVCRGRHIVIVRSAFFGIKGKVEFINVCWLSGHAILVREHLLLVDAAGIGTRQVVARDVARPSTGLIEVVADAVPRQLGPVLAVVQTRTRGRLGEHGRAQTPVLRRTGQEPRGDRGEVDAALRTLEVVHIAHTSLLATGAAHTGDEVGELGRQAQVRRGFGVDARQQVHQLRHQRHLASPVHIQSPDGIARRLVAEIVLLRQRLLVQVHHRGANVEVLLHLVVQVQSQHPLGGHAERVVL